jgi:hypothetical protein
MAPATSMFFLRIFLHATPGSVDTPTVAAQPGEAPYPRFKLVTIQLILVGLLRFSLGR